MLLWILILQHKNTEFCGGSCKVTSKRPPLKILFFVRNSVVEYKVADIFNYLLKLDVKFTEYDFLLQHLTVFGNQSQFRIRLQVSFQMSGNETNQVL